MQRSQRTRTPAAPRSRQPQALSAKAVASGVTSKSTAISKKDGVPKKVSDAPAQPSAALKKRQRLVPPPAIDPSASSDLDQALLAAQQQMPSSSSFSVYPDGDKENIAPPRPSTMRARSTSLDSLAELQADYVPSASTSMVKPPTTRPKFRNVHPLASTPLASPSRRNLAASSKPRRPLSELDRNMLSLSPQPPPDDSNPTYGDLFAKSGQSSLVTSNKERGVPSGAMVAMKLERVKDFVGSSSGVEYDTEVTSTEREGRKGSVEVVSDIEDLFGFVAAQKKIAQQKSRVPASQRDMGVGRSARAQPAKAMNEEASSSAEPTAHQPLFEDDETVDEQAERDSDAAIIEEGIKMRSHRAELGSRAAPSPLMEDISDLSSPEPDTDDHLPSRQPGGKKQVPSASLQRKARKDQKADQPERVTLEDLLNDSEVLPRRSASGSTVKSKKQSKSRSGVSKTAADKSKVIKKAVVTKQPQKKTTKREKAKETQDAAEVSQSIVTASTRRSKAAKGNSATHAVPGREHSGRQGLKRAEDSLKGYTLGEEWVI